MKYDRTIIAYHGCDATVAERVLAGEAFKKSENDYDWLGKGIYFWEYGADRAMKFAETQVKRGRARKPAIVGALIQLGNCFDLMDTRFTDELAVAYTLLQRVHDETGDPLPSNKGNTPEQKLRKLDCAVLNLYFESLENDPETPVRYDSVRCGFVEGPAAYPGSGISRQSHVQLAIRNPSCVVGVFRPQ